MAETRNNKLFVLIFGLVWIAFGVFGLFDAPEKKLLISSQFIAGIIHLVYAIVLYRKKILNLQGRSLHANMKRPASYFEHESNLIKGAHFDKLSVTDDTILPLPLRYRPLWPVLPVWRN